MRKNELTSNTSPSKMKHIGIYSFIHADGNLSVKQCETP